MQVTAGAMVFLAGIALMVYAVNALYGMPLMCAMVLLWLTLVEYAVGRAWWVDICEVRDARRLRRVGA